MIADQGGLLPILGPGCWAFSRSLLVVQQGLRTPTVLDLRQGASGSRAHTDLSALVTLGALLRDVWKGRSTAPDAADSSVSPLPGDQNRGETHATPEQTEVGTPPRAEGSAGDTR